jgi:hypothetical protein
MSMEGAKPFFFFFSFSFLLVAFYELKTIPGYKYQIKILKILPSSIKLGKNIKKPPKLSVVFNIAP